MEDELETPEASVKNSKAGEMIHAARLATGLDAQKLAASLRISVEALEAIEACQYDRLPGDPYVRALLGSLARSLTLNPQKLLQAYNSEIGNKADDQPATPYKDTSQIHILAHRKLFVALLAVLLIALLFILGKVNSSSEKNAPVAASNEPRTDTVAVIAPVDSIPESSSLQPDSVAGRSDSVSGVAAKNDSVRSAGKPVAAKTKMDTAAKAAAAKSADTTHKALAPVMNRVTVKPLVDSVWMRVLRHGKPETIVLLLLSKPPVEVAHTDTIVLILGKRHSVELTLGDTTFVPARKRFKLLGKKITYF